MRRGHDYWDREQTWDGGGGVSKNDLDGSGGRRYLLLGDVLSMSEVRVPAS